MWVSVWSAMVVSDALPVGFAACFANSVLPHKRERSEGGPTSHDFPIVLADLVKKIHNHKAAALEGTLAGCPLALRLPLIMYSSVYLWFDSSALSTKEFLGISSAFPSSFQGPGKDD